MGRAKIFGALAAASAIIFLAGAKSTAGEKITLDKLLDKMVNLDWLYQPPFPGEKQTQFSSYDRKSQIVNGVKIDWFANDDYGNYYGEQAVPGGKEYIMADFQGPGVIARIWSANPGKDRWRIYLDGSDKPVVDEPGEQLLSGLGPYFKKPYAGKRSMGYLLLFPMPFAKSCKVALFTTAPKKPPRYFHVDVLTLPKDAEVETFQLDDLKKYSEKIAETARAMDERKPQNPANVKEITFKYLKQSSEDYSAFVAGPAIIRLIEIKVSAQNKQELRKILNQAVLIGNFEDSPSFINAPLAAFFGSTPGVNTYKSIASSISWDEKTKTVTLKSWWPMPLRGFAAFHLKNFSKQDIKISGRVLVEEKDPGPDALYFHATYNYLDHHPTRPFMDWNLLSAASGEGRYVGTMLSIRNPDYAWWGEGDEKVFVNNEDFPSIFGTGTEDYFSYAWGARFLKFDHAQYGIPLAAKKLPLILLTPFQSGPFRIVMTDERLEEMCSQYRWHILDQVPFEKSISFNLEVWHWTPDITFDLQAMSFWYGDRNIKYETQNLEPEKIPNW
jgi:hypothetical protein